MQQITWSDGRQKQVRIKGEVVHLGGRRYEPLGRVGNPWSADTVAFQVVDTLGNVVCTHPNSPTVTVSEPLCLTQVGRPAAARFHDNHERRTTEDTRQVGTLSASGTSRHHHLGWIVSAVRVLFQHIHHPVDHPPVGDIRVHVGREAVKGPYLGGKATSKRQFLVTRGKDSPAQLESDRGAGAADSRRKRV